ncbi:hypothetical protein MRB53_022619 [Persea americana]|uniref:Uncharacterized protein n=1 Tax=Persea americana TaxID=3435 RepID=A0ACC2L7B7_PERAE|nr:hypothetical protein MRB53_022619 [Persea americana]
MSDAEKAPFVAKAEKRKTEYNKDMAAYNNKQSKKGSNEEEGSDKSRSEINDEEEESGEVIWNRKMRGMIRDQINLVVRNMML